MDDLISRKAAIDSICRTVCDNPEICESPCDEIKVLETMPSAQPETHEERTETHACDLISRQAAIDALGGNEPVGDPSKMDDDDVVKMWERIRIINIINKLPSAQPEQRWIPVDLRNNSPEENKVVLLGVRFQDDFKYFVTSRQDYNYWTGLGREINGELRWQPLPEQYRAERRTDEA